AAAVLEQLLARVAGLLQAAESDLEALAGRPQADVLARRAQLRSAMRQALALPGSASPVDSAPGAPNICTPSGGTNGEYVSTCSYLGLPPSQKIVHSGHGLELRPVGRDGLAGASPTSQGSGDLAWGCVPPPRPQRPRTPGVKRSRSRRAQPKWASWAYRVARELRHVWDFLDGEPIARVAATLGGRLAPEAPDGQEWTANRLSDLVHQERDGKRLLVAPQRRLAYLRDLLDTLPAQCRRADRVTDQRRAEARQHAAVVAQRRGERDQERAAQAVAAATASTDRGRVARRVALYLARPVAAAAGVCIGCADTSGVQPRDFGKRQVPLCGGCWPALEPDQ
ncbi:MAG: hypothetical protein ACRDUV_13505, partial [Pseudonocardiaceae bacterium]